MPESTLEAVSFWRSESERREWSARPIHKEVFDKVLGAAKDVSHTLQTVDQSWGL